MKKTKFTETYILKILSEYEAEQKANLAFCLLAGVILQGCGLGSYGGTPIPGDTPPQTEILEIVLTPDTVATQETLLLHCIIEDSLDDRFTYDWSMSEERTVAVNGTKNGPKIKWVAPDYSHLQPGEVLTILRGVTVDNGSEDSSEVYQQFSNPVIKK